ncbi:MAG: lactate racemase domain-containing protein, partial [Actinomycetota bacterium]
LAKPGAKVTIAFDDATVGQYGPVWSTAIPIILAELERGGVKREDVRLICANALHRKFTHDELSKLIGDDLVREFGDRLYCHDAEDADNLVHLGTTEYGYHVELNKAVVDDDLTIYLNCSTVRGFSGGWKSICVGLSTFRSIRAHHNPDDMSMSFDRNRMHEMLDEMGALVTKELGAGRIFKLETVQANPLQVSQVLGGSVDATRAKTVEIMRAHQRNRRDLVAEKVDIVVYGVPDWSPYGAYSSMNPILTLISTGLGYMGGVIEAFGKPGCTVVLATPCRNQWNAQHHASYPEVWERVLTQTLDPYEARERFEDDFATRAEYIDAYRHRNAFHGVHGIMAIFPLKRLKHAGRVFVAGAEDPLLPRHVGFEPFETVEEAVAEAGQIHGANATVAAVRYPAATSRR